MCVFSSPKAPPPPIKYATVKTPDGNSVGNRNKRLEAQYRASQTTMTSPKGVLAQPNVAVKALMGQ